MEQYRLTIGKIYGINFGVHYIKSWELRFNFLCFYIVIGLSKYASGTNTFWNNHNV